MRMTRGIFVGFTLLAATTSAHAQFQRPSLADSFRLGSGGGVLCQVQTRSRDDAIKTIFDRAWSIVCRDASRPIGKLYALRGTSADVKQRLNDIRKSQATCVSPETKVSFDGLTGVDALQCSLNDAQVGYNVLVRAQGNTVWVAEGLSGYDSALKLGLRTIMADRNVPGKVTVATTSVDDPVAFARVQAGSLDPDQALAEGYRRNNSGNYAEAAEFFDTLQQRTDGSAKGEARLGEYLVNRALQKSNLGEFAEAEALFAEARKVPTVDRIQTRLRRNFEAMHLLNQQQYGAALARLDVPVAAIPRTQHLPNSAIEIGAQVAAEINAGLPVGQRMGATESAALTPEERAIFLDGQALQLRGTLLRLSGKPAEGRAALEKSFTDVLEVRDGRVISVIRLRSQIMAELALALEDQGDITGAEARMRDALALLETRYPQTVALNGARARLAALLARHGRSAEAMDIYRTVVQSAAGSHSSTTGLGNLLSPYFALLSEQIKTNPALVDDMFLASQTLVRPGVADTQAILARELSEGNSEATRLFRQARTLERDIERSRIELANLAAITEKNADVARAIAAVRLDIDSLEKEQVATEASLGAFPQYRAIAIQAIGLQDLKAVLKPGEAYYKLSALGRSVYAIFVDQSGATGYKVPLSVSQLDAAVDGIRDTISKNEGGQVNTYAFDVPLARQLYVALFNPVASRASAATHLIFEPDGGMLRLPVNLLIASQSGVDAYAARIAKPDADEFNLTGIDWLGRNRAISTSVSARSFREARNTPASAAQKQFLGFGNNAPVSATTRVAATRSMSGGGALDCSWPMSEWNKPISDAELRVAQSAVGIGQSKIVTGADFSDTGIMERTDLRDYRILQFATHGLVTAPRPECPARPALLTSFGPRDSDGLLTFREIYELKIDADLVILSACDTAGRASVAATREAGVTTGGGSALDGLVRAFIGAGGRSVLASHWPVPDDFQATEHLLAGFFQADAGASIGQALAKAQIALMDDPMTSHPYYWSGFAIIGDGAKSLLAAH
jgi:CHAT domain-containing protein